MTSNAPSLDRLKHADAIEAPRVDRSTFRQGWLVRTRLDALLDDHSISGVVWQAAVEYRDCCNRLLAGPPGPGTERTSGGTDAHGRQASLLDAATRVVAVERAIGLDATRLCRAVIMLDRSWRDLGRWLGRDRETARRVAVVALRALADAWTGG